MALCSVNISRSKYHQWVGVTVAIYFILYYETNVRGRCGHSLVGANLEAGEFELPSYHLLSTSEKIKVNGS